MGATTSSADGGVPSSTSGNNNNLSLPLAVYLHLEDEYLASSRRGDAKIDIFRRLERLYKQEIDEIAKSNNFAISLSPLREAVHAQEPKVYYSRSPRAPTLTPPLPRGSSAAPWRARQRPKSVGSASSSPESRPRSSQTSSEPAVRMSFTTLWSFAWTSVAARTRLDPLSSSMIDTAILPIIESDQELILLIYLLRSLSREFEGHVRFRLRLLWQKVALTTSQNHVVADNFDSALVGFPVSPLSTATVADSARNKSAAERSLISALRIMDDCYFFLDNYCATYVPRNTNWRSEVEILLQELLTASPIVNTSCLGSSTTLAFHVARSIEFISVAERAQTPTSVESPRERRQVKEESRKGLKRPVYFVKVLPVAGITVLQAIQRLISSASCLLEERYKHHSDFDTFELYMRAGSLLLQRVEDDLNIELHKLHVERANTYENLRICHGLRWRCGPLIFRFCNPGADLHIDDNLEDLCKDVGILLRRGVNYFKDPDVETLRRLFPEKMSEIGKTDAQKWEMIRKELQNASRSKKIAPGDWETRPRKIRKVLGMVLSSLETFRLLFKPKVIAAKKPVTSPTASVDPSRCSSKEELHEH